MVLVFLASCAGGGDTEVHMRGHVFEPATLTISAGDTVTWVNDSDESHTVTAFDESFPADAEYFSSGGASNEEEANDSLPSELIDPGGTFEVTLTQTGSYSYYCIPHQDQGMRGTIIVEP